MSGFLSDVGKAVSDGVDAAAEAVTDGVNAAAEAVSDGVNAAAEAISDGVNAAAEAVSDGVNAAAEAISDGVDAAGRAVSRGLGAVNNACNKANDSIEAIRETVVSSPDILADMIADSIVGQYWSDLWDLNVDSVNAIEGILEDTAEELANDEDVPGFIRDYMNGFIGADVPCNFFGMLGAGCRGVEEMLSEVYKGTSGVLGHPCQTAENIVDALIIAGEATKYFIEDPQKATENAISSVSDWWNDKTTYEKIRTVVEAYIVYRMIASSGSKGKTVTLESEEAAGTIAGEAGEIAGSEGIAAEAIEGAAGKGKIRIKSAGESGSNTLTDAQKSRLNALDNTIEHNLKDSDFSGTLRDLQGDPVPNFQGGYYDHLTEMKQSYKSLNKIKKGLEGSLKNPNLSSVDKEILQKGLDKTNAYIQKIEELFRPFGGI